MKRFSKIAICAVALLACAGADRPDPDTEPAQCDSMLQTKQSTERTALDLQESKVGSNVKDSLKGKGKGKGKGTFAVVAERTSIEVGLQQLFKAHAEALFQVHGRVLKVIETKKKRLSSPTVAKDDERAVAVECELEALADEACSIEKCQSNCTDTYRNMLRFCGPDSTRGKMAQEALRECQEPIPAGTAAPSPLSEEEMKTCMPSVMAFLDACPSEEGAGGGLPDFEKLCSEACQSSISGIMEDCPTMMEDEHLSFAIGIMSGMCLEPSCLHAIVQLRPGSPAATACKMDGSGACCEDCQSALCSIMTNCAGEKTNFPGDQRELMEMTNFLVSATEECPCV
jgi:hypothetical protein